MPFVTDLWESSVPKEADFHSSFLFLGIQEYPIFLDLLHPGTGQSKNPLRRTHTPHQGDWSKPLHRSQVLGGVMCSKDPDTAFD